VRASAASLPPAMQNTVSQKAVMWAGAFGLDRAQASLISTSLPASDSLDFWVSDPAAGLKRLLAARDDGTGADPTLLAHIALRAGDVARAETLLDEESWREYGPAMIFRQAKLYEQTGRPADARMAYRRFLTLWSGADADLPPMIDARAALKGWNNQ
jgi:hypothetical protein